ncbi:MAG: hypothetical protein WBM32_21400 [Crocosphaera sp.]|jgi:hypothetical protein
MSGHYKFSQLIEKFSEQRQVKICQKTDQLKATMDSTLEERGKLIPEDKNDLRNEHF